MIDFLDIFFHGDYRKLNKFISFNNWKEALKIFNDRINVRNEDFRYILTENYMIFKFEDRIHIIFINEKYVLCNANREVIADLELLMGLCLLYSQLYFPEVSLRLITSEYLSISTIVPNDVLKQVGDKYVEDNASKIDKYFWSTFPEDLNALTEYCKEIHLEFDKHNDLEIILNINIESNTFLENKIYNPIRYRDLRLVLNFINRIYNDYYIIWVD